MICILLNVEQNDKQTEKVKEEKAKSRKEKEKRKNHNLNIFSTCNIFLSLFYR